MSYKKIKNLDGIIKNNETIQVTEDKALSNAIIKSILQHENNDYLQDEIKIGSKTKISHIKHIRVYILLSLLFVSNISIIIYLIVNSNNTISERVSNLDQNLNQLIDDATEIRKFMNLPPLFYENSEMLSDELDATVDTHFLSSANQTNEDVLLIKAEEVQNKYQLDRVSKNLYEFILENNIVLLVKKYDFSVEQNNLRLIIKFNKSIIASLEVLYDENQKLTGFKLTSNIISISHIIKLNEFEFILKTLKTTINQNLQRSQEIKNSVNKLFNDNNMRLFFIANRAYFKYSLENNVYLWEIFNIENNRVGIIELIAHSITLRSNQINIDVYTNNNEKLIKKIDEDIKKINYLTFSENLFMNRTNLLKKYISNNSFKTKLKQYNLEVAEVFREDDDYLYYDILFGNYLVKIGAFAIQKSNSSFWIVDSQDIPISQSTILDITSPDIKDQLQTQNIVLVGSHNNLADTIIIVHIVDKTKVKVLSIPRDLYYKGRKINWYFKRFTPANFIKVLEECTGLPLYQYVFVDMYAFISIIDILEGITVYLDEDLVDPSYKIKENGVISYLNYSQGEHFLTGIEALRIARSRYSSSDFSRSARQQAILDGIRDKLNSIDNISSFISVVKIINQVYPYIDTNITLFELTRLAQKYKNARINDKVILSTANALYSTYSEIYEKNLTESEVLPEEKGQWILLPLNNDWNYLKIFIENSIIN